jgi:hypothetical protein
MERVDLRHTLLEQDAGFIAPVDLGLRPGDDLEPAMQPRQPTIGVGLTSQALTRVGDVELDPLVVPVEAVLGDQPLMDHTRAQPRVGGQPSVDHRCDPVDLACHGAAPRRRGRWPGRGVGRQVLLDGAPVQADLIGDLCPGHAGGTQWLVAA